MSFTSTRPRSRSLRLNPLEDRITPDAGELLRTVPIPEPHAGDAFGYSVAMDEKYVIVGAPYYDVTDFPDSGAAFVFDRASGDLVARILNPQPATGDRYGWSVTIRNGSGWIGAPYDDPNGVADSGTVWSYSAANGGLVGGVPMENPSPAAGDLFGYSVARDAFGNSLAVGAPGDDAGATDAGRAYVTGWSSGVIFQVPASNPEPAAGDRFGESVAVTVLGQLLAGAPGDDVGTTVDAGRAFVYDFDAQGIFLTFASPTPVTGGRFGAAVAISGNTMMGLIGAPGDTSGGVAGAGAAYVYDIDTYGLSTYGNIIATLANPSPTGGDQFGAALAADGLLALVGAPGDLGEAGRAYEFRASTGELLATLANPTPNSGDLFGTVALSGSRGVVGAPGEDPAGVSGAGTAFVFDTNNLPKVTDDTAVVPRDAGPTPVLALGTDSGLPDQGEWLTIVDVEHRPGSGVVQIAAGGRSVTYDPAQGFTGTDTFQYTVDDGRGGRATARVNVIVSPPNQSRIGTLGPANPDGQWQNDATNVAANESWVVVRPNDLGPIRVYNTGGGLVRTLPNAINGFAFALALSGDRVLVGNDTAREAYLYDLTTGALLRTFRPPSAVTLFGVAVALDGDTVAVGSYEDYEGFGGPNPNTPGRVFIYSAATGELVRTIRNPTFDYTEEGFGTAVAVSGNTLVVGAYHGEVSANLILGQAYIFDLATGDLKHTLNSAARHFHGLFGGAVAVSGNRVAVGGRERVYLFDATTGNLTGQLGDPTANGFDIFGLSVAMAGNRVLVGELWDDSLGLADAGAAHLFDADSGALLRSFTSPVPQASAQFGASVALTGTRAVIGTWQGTGQASAAYMFDSRLPPAVRDDRLIIPEDGPATAVNVLANDFTVPGAGELTVTAFTQPAHGIVTFTNGVVRYRPNPDYFGTDEFTYTATDATGASTTATVRVSVTPVADAPVVQPATFAILEHSPYGTVVGTVTATDADGDVLRYRIAGGNMGAAFAINPITGRITVTNPGVLDYETTPTFVLTVEARDPGGLTGTAAITINLIDRPEGRSALAMSSGEADLVVSTLRESRVAVTVLSTADFNARSVNLSTLRFGRTGEESSLSRFAGGRPRVRFADVNGDGRADLIAEFDVARTGLQAGDTRAVLTGRLRDGTAFSIEYRVTVR